MADDYRDIAGGGDSGNPGSAEAYGRWITGAQDYLQKGGQLDASGGWDPATGHYGTPPGYRVENGQLVTDTKLWSSIYKGLLGTAGMATLGLLVGPVLAGSSPTLEGISAGGGGATSIPSGAALGPTTGESMAATTSALTPPASIAAPAGSSFLAGNTGNIVKALTTLAATFGGHAIGQAAGAGNVPPQLNDLLNMAVDRQKQQIPITQAVDQGIYQMLPNFARQGTTPPAIGGAQALLDVAHRRPDGGM